MGNEQTDVTLYHVLPYTGGERFRQEESEGEHVYEVDREADGVPLLGRFT